ncbi:MAG TPA: DUF2087 domain-containing protein [Anaerolineae bacterium]
MKQPQMEVLLEFFKALGQVERLQIVGLLIDEPRTLAELAEALAAKESTVMRHLSQLQEAGLILERQVAFSATYHLDRKALEQFNQVIFAQHNKAKSETREDLMQKVFRHYVDGERLKELPANPDEEKIILHWLAEQFQPGIRYPEREVNQVLNRHHPDHALLRRYLVDNRLMERAGGFYWRKEA